MSNRKDTVLVTEVRFYISVQELSSSFGIDRKLIKEIIDEGIVEVQKDANEELQFDSTALHRIRTALRLHRDLGINFAGAALVLDLLEELETLRSNR